MHDLLRSHGSIAGHHSRLHPRLPLPMHLLTRQKHNQQWGSHHQVPELVLRNINGPKLDNEFHDSRPRAEIPRFYDEPVRVEEWRKYFMVPHS